LTIAPDNPAAATRLLRTIGHKIDLLRDFPWLGTRRSDIRPGLRMMVARPFLILYANYPDRVDEVVETVEIVRVVDGRRDLRRLF
jgi:toxin ParE1/3/4